MFPPAEFKSRVAKVRAAMAEQGLNALVAVDTGGHMRSGNVRYLTGFVGPIAPHLMVVVVTPKRVALCVQPGLEGSEVKLARQNPIANDVFSTSSGMWEYIGDKDIKSALDKAKVTGGKVGIDGLNVVTEPIAKAIRAALSGYEMVPQTGIVEKLRMIKSPAECEAIREAARLSDIGMKAFIKSIKPGGKVTVSISECEHAVKKAGAEEGFMFMTPSDKPFMWGNAAGHGTLGETFKEGDMVSCEVNAKYEGYMGQVARSFVIGKASAEQKRHWEVALSAYKKLASMLKPGAKASEIFLAGDEVIKKAGYKPISHRNGHGMGLTIAETLNIFETDHTEIRPGQFIVVHINAPLPEAAVILLGHGFLITETGREELHKMPFKMEI